MFSVLSKFVRARRARAHFADSIVDKTVTASSPLVTARDCTWNKSSTNPIATQEPPVASAATIGGGVQRAGRGAAWSFMNFTVS